MSNYDMDELERKGELPRFATDDDAGFVDDQKNIEEIQERVRMSQKQKAHWNSYVSGKLEERPTLEKEEITSPNHYRNGKVEPLDYIIANELDFLEGNIVKYITRHTYKGGVNDLLKARTYLEKLIERERDGR